MIQTEHEPKGPERFSLLNSLYLYLACPLLSLSTIFLLSLKKTISLPLFEEYPKGLGRDSCAWWRGEGAVWVDLVLHL